MSTAKVNFKGLLTVVKTNNYDKVKLLLEKQGLKENNHKNNRLALYHAIQAGRSDIVKLLLEYGCLADETKADDVFYTTLDYAKEDTEMLKLLLRAGASTAGKNFKQQTPLIRAMSKNYYAAVDVMLSMYDTDSIDPLNKNEIIHFTIACMRNNRKLVECFIQKGLIIDSVLNHHYDDWTGYTPLHCTVKHLSVTGVKMLLEFGANMTIRDEDGCSPLHLAYYIWKNTIKSFAMYEREKVSQIIDSILSAHKSVAANPTDTNGLSHLHIACTKSDRQSIEVIKLLVGVNSNVNAQDKFGETALSYAALNVKSDAVKVLLNHGADVNVVDNSNVCLLERVSILINRDSSTPFTVFKILILHVKKLMLIGYSVSLDNSDICARSKLATAKAIRDFNKELDTLKENKIDQRTTLYDILFKSEQQMARHVKNEAFESAVNDITQSNSFPNYGYLLNLKFREGQARNRILDRAERSLQLLTKIGFPEPCVNRIFDYLTNRDLKILIYVAERYCRKTQFLN